MNREIKFRAWNLLQGRWEKKLCLYLDDGQIGDVSDCFHNEENKENYVIQQFTGLLDKNKKEIYEGDIVNYNPDNRNFVRIGVIEFSDYYHGWSIKDLEPYFGDFSLASPFLSFNNVEVIGNIFENPELLK